MLNAIWLTAVSAIFTQANAASAVFWARQQNRTRLKENLNALAREAGVGFVLADLSVLLD